MEETRLQNVNNGQKGMERVVALEEKTKAMGTAHLVIQKGNKTMVLPETGVKVEKHS